MDRSRLVRVLGFPATLIHGDTLVLDRWRWLKARLPITTRAERLIDIGCGSGAFSIGSSLRGYQALGLSWDDRNQRVAAERAALCGAATARFETLDVRHLDRRNDLYGNFDVALCLENIEHIIDDRKLINDISSCLKPGGRLLLTTPNFSYRPITSEDEGPFLPIEDGRHVRRGYSEAMLKELCDGAGLAIERISYCGGFMSQKVTWMQRTLSKIHPLLAWLLILPLRPLPIALDYVIGSLTGWPYFSICLEGRKPQ
jgi:SAM-dependent methyltransferase